MQDRKFFTSMAAALFFMAGITTSCVNDDVLNQDSFDGRSPINFTSSVASRTTDQTIQETQIKEGNTVGVFIANVDDAEVSTQTISTNNVKLIADANGALNVEAGNEPIYFPEGASSVDIYAYAPYNANFSNNLNNNVTFTVALDQGSDDNYIASDFMIAQNKGVSTDNSNVSLLFDHKMVKLNLNFNSSLSEQLKGATVTVSGVKTEANVNICTGIVTSTETVAPTEGITAATFNSENSELTASVIFVPQTVPSGQLKVTVTNSSTSFSKEAVLDQKMVFKGGVRYAYNVELKNEQLTLTPSSQINNWGNAEISAYGIGDYFKSDGTFIKNSELNGDNKEGIVAVIFSTEVSAEDAKVGYTAYAMGLNAFNNKQWTLGTTSVGTLVTDYTSALSDLDGRIKSQAIFNSAQTADKLGGCYVNYTDGSSYTTNNPLPEGDLTSGWFTPSFGQMVQIFNNLGDANISENMTGINHNASYSAMYAINDETVIDKINGYVTAVNTDVTLFPKTQDNTCKFATVTELNDNNLWGFSTGKVTLSQDQNAEIYSWGFGKNIGKSYVSVAPCIAIKLPTSASETTTAE